MGHTHPRLTVTRDLCYATWKHMMLDSRAIRMHSLIMMTQPAVCRFAYAYFTGIRITGRGRTGMRN